MDTTTATIPMFGVGATVQSGWRHGIVEALLPPTRQGRPYWRARVRWQKCYGRSNHSTVKTTDLTVVEAG